MLACVVAAGDLPHPCLQVCLRQFFEAQQPEAPGARETQAVEVALLRVRVIEYLRRVRERAKILGQEMLEPRLAVVGARRASARPCTVL